VSRNELIPAPEAETPARPAPLPQGRPASPEVLDAEFSEAPSRHLRDYLRVVYKYRWLACTCFGLTLGLTVFITLLTPRTYTATTRLQVTRQSPIQLQLEQNVLRVDENDRNVNGTSSFLSTQVAVLQSRDLAERVIRHHRLAENEAFLQPRAGRAGLLTVSGRILSLLRPRGLGGAPATGNEDADTGGATEAEPRLLDRYIGYVAVRDVRNTDLVEVSFTTPNPALSAFLVAAHTQAYMEANEEARLVTNVTAKAFLGQQLRESQQRIERSEAALRAFAAEHPNVAIDDETKVVGQRISELSSLLTKTEGTRVGLESRYEFLTKPDTEPLAYFLDRPGVQKLRLALLDLGAQEASVSDRLGPNHTQMVELRQQAKTIEAQLRTEVEHEVAAVRAHHGALQMREDRVRGKLEEQEHAAIGLQGVAARYEMVKKDAETARALHDSLLKQQMDTDVNSELAPSNIRVVERAEVPQHATKPKVSLNLTLGLIAGLVFGLGSAFACEYFDNSVKSSEDVADLLQLSTLATIPNFSLARRRSGSKPLVIGTPGGNGKGNGNGNGAGSSESGSRAEDLVVLHEPRSVVAEAFRSLRTAVLFSAPGAPPRVILLTSAGVGEGKTFTSLNLATTLADSGSRVLLIDADLRRAGCHRAFGIVNERGLSSFLAGQVTLAEAIRVLDAPKLSFIPAGPTPPNPAELVGSSRMRDTLEQLRDEYDFVIIDSPPTLPVTDAVVLAREADGIVLVVKGHDTPRELVRRARDQLVHAGAHILGALVNNVDLGWGDLYYYNRYYGTYYGRPEAREGLEQHA
jgi:succinoglycan biosynthesis transport protein ExoP